MTMFTALLAAAAVALPSVAGAPSAPPAKTLYITTYANSTDTTNQTLFALSLANNVLPQTASADCGPGASWLTFDNVWRILYCTSEGGLSNNWQGELFSFAPGAGNFTLIQRSGLSAAAPVHHSLHHRDLTTYRAQLTYADYGGTLKNWAVGSKGHFNQIGEEDIPFTNKAGDPDSQTKAHPHQALPDPSGNYIFVPDLGNDNIRIMAFNTTNGTNGQWIYTTDFPVKSRSGPRHGAFYTDKTGRVSYYVVGELGNEIHQFYMSMPGYAGNNGSGEYAFVKTIGVYGTMTAPNLTYSGEMHTSPDNKFLTVSTRGDMLSNGGDSLSTFTINDQDGTLTYLGYGPCGGSYPRAFQFNNDGTLVAVALQHSQKLVVLSRNKDTGQVGGVIAEKPFTGNVSSVVWDE